MSLITFFETKDGLLLSGDSRLTYTETGKYIDNTYKVFCYGDRIGIAFHNSADISGKPMDMILQEFVDRPKSNPTVKEVACSLRNYIKKQKENLDTVFYVLGYDNGNRQIYKFDLSKQEFLDWSNNLHGSGGDDEVAWSHIQGHYEEHETVDKAIKFIHFIYEESSKEICTIGGEIDILFISKAGNATWKQRK